MVFEIKNLHERYGPIVRITPNELSFTDPAAWKDIYGHRPEGELAKWDGFYLLQGNLSTTHIVSAPKDEHRMLRKQLAPGFSERAMRAQEPIIGGYVELLIQRLREETSKESKVVDMKDWVNFKTFDVIGKLAFGSDFGCLADSKWHPWVKMIATHVKVVAYMQTLRALCLVWITQLAMRSGLISSHADHAQNVHEKMKRRAELGTERLDLIEGLIQKRHELVRTQHLQSNMKPKLIRQKPLRRIEMNASVLILAGSETTATLLSGAVFALLTNPDQMAKLINEAHSKFSHDEEITLTSVQKLT
jgi:cytochrome P450